MFCPPNRWPHSFMFVRWNLSKVSLRMNAINCIFDNMSLLNANWWQLISFQVVVYVYASIRACMCMYLCFAICMNRFDSWITPCGAWWITIKSEWQSNVAIKYGGMLINPSVNKSQYIHIYQLEHHIYAK